MEARGRQILVYDTDMAVPIPLNKFDFLLYLDTPLHLWAKAHNRFDSTLSDMEIHLGAQGYTVEPFARQFIESHIRGRSQDETLRWQESFASAHFTVRPDALVHKPTANTYDLYEVKSATAVSKEHIYDAAYQCAVLSKLITIGRVHILHLNKAYNLADKLDITQLFIADDITDKVL